LVKIQKQAKGNFLVPFPKKLMEHYGYTENTQFMWCPGERGPVLIPLKKGD
jgi:hypothetical protein